MLLGEEVHFRGKELLSFSFCLPSQKDGERGSTLKGKNVFLFPLRVDPIYNGYIIQGSKQEVSKVVPLHKNGHPHPPKNHKGKHLKSPNPKDKPLSLFPILQLYIYIHNQVEKHEVVNSDVEQFEVEKSDVGKSEVEKSEDAPVSKVKVKKASYCRKPQV